MLPTSAAELELLELVAPPIERVLPDLIEWLDARLGEEGHFESERAETWMRRVALPSGAVRTLGEALGLLGLLDEMTPRSLSGQSLDELVEGFLRRRLREVSADEAHSALATDNVFFELTELGARCLLEGEALGEPRSMDEWARLLRGEREDAPDPSWFGAALGEASSLSKQELRRLTRRLPPRAHQLLRWLERAGLLRKDGGQLFSLGPSFLVRLLEIRATSHALRLSPYEWGRALSHPAAAPAIFEALGRAARSADDEPVTQLLDAMGSEEGDASASGLLRALEAVTLCWGLAALGGRRLPNELEQELLREAGRFVVPFEGALEPRFVPNRPSNGLYHRDFWLLAWASLTETAELLPAFLRPLLGSAKLRARVLEAALCSAGQLPETERVALFLLLDRALSADDGPHPSPPSRLLDELVSAAREGLAYPETWSELSELGSIGGAELLRALAVERGQDGALLDGLTLAAPEQPELSSVLGPQLGREITRRFTQKQLERRVELGHHVDWPSLLPHQFAGWATQSQRPLPAPAAAHLPLETAGMLLAERGPSAFEAGALATLWQRAPLRLAESARRALERGDRAALAALFESADGAGALALLRAWPSAADLLGLAPDLLDQVRYYLVQLGQAGGAAAELAGTLLDSLERRLLPLRLARR